jgi:hypothetical protein
MTRRLRAQLVHRGPAETRSQAASTSDDVLIHCQVDTYVGWASISSSAHCYICMLVRTNAQQT